MDLEKDLRAYAPFGVQVSKKTWDWLRLGRLFPENHSIPVSSETFRIRKLADAYNIACVHSQIGLWPIRPGQLVTVGIINDILRYLMRLYCCQDNPNILSGALGWMTARGMENVSGTTTRAVVEYFPPHEVIKGRPAIEYIDASWKLGPHRELIAQESILLSMAMTNPAFGPFRVIFDNTDLRENAPYQTFIGKIEEYLQDKPVFGPLGEPLFECLRAPTKACPNSLEGQLDYIKTRWASFLPKDLLNMLLLAGDILQEEHRVRGWGPGPNIALEFGKYAYGGAQYDYPEPAAFSRDADWMSNVVIMAKTVYVWLDQLSKKYKRPIRRLDDIPDEELDRLARWGFSGLWLIGVWERSRASQRIKQIMGNPEAAPSAYSLYDYIIAHDLGGEAAYQNLKERAWRRGIRLASDMVPNHMGIYSRWVVEHPDWFMDSDYPPFPVYRFTGVNLSEDERVTVQIEDGYWEHRDAAVVFKRIDNHTGSVRYIYHGNDGTSTPWNDTAQLNFMKAEVREGVLQTILHVARKFPIIRFDAAMTLAKKHYQRLWFPLPGEGGAIPSRAEHSMTRAEFDAVFPKEFWRDVVDRIATEIPDTLLLAEAFWLMEGYFVRTLGMHRVYNSAFMNMLKMEDNAKYRTTVKNVLEFSPEVLKRFVNFMNNPDEKTAVEQFGKGDKYIGIAVMMVTMPGLPMFGHGQVEGFTEKYGMEYYRAYWDERVDEELVRRHEREIFPLMRRRHLFSGSQNFALYDFMNPGGWVNENVFAYSNISGSERAIIIYNNSYDSTDGTIHTSTAINVGEAEEKAFVRKSIVDALHLNTAPGHYYAFTDYRGGLQYIRSGRQFADEGLFVRLHGYQYYALLDFSEIYDADGTWATLHGRLGINGVHDLQRVHQELILEAVLNPFKGLLYGFASKFAEDDSITANINVRRTFISEFISSVQRRLSGSEMVDERAPRDTETVYERFITDSWLITILTSDPKLMMLLDPISMWSILETAKEILAQASPAKKQIEIKQTILHDLLLLVTMRNGYADKYKNGDIGYQYAGLIELLFTVPELMHVFADKTPVVDWNEFFAQPIIRKFLQVNEHDHILYFNKEMFELVMRGAALATLYVCISSRTASKSRVNDSVTLLNDILAIAEDSSYRVDKFVESMQSR